MSLNHEWTLIETATRSAQAAAQLVWIGYDNGVPTCPCSGGRPRLPLSRGVPPGGYILVPSDSGVRLSNF